MNTHETYVSLETAKQLKQAGFDWGCRGISVLDSENDPEYVFSTANFTNTSKEIEGYIRFSAPTLEVAQRWLREGKNFILDVQFSNTGHNWFLRYCDVTVHGMSDGHWHNIGDRSGYKTYEDALEDGLKISLQLITTDYGLHREK